MSGRTERLDELLREEISAVLSRDVQDPRIGFVTVTRVEVTRDLSHATVWVSIIGSPEERRDSIRGLERAMPFVRGRLAPLRMRRIPQLHVRYDESVERGTRVLRLLDELERGEEPSDIA
ncbi:MAG: 30S ribosome-binding factor RbfA, partial [Chloroflexi bacterium]|nr:30S ribosome-binding factor RbfA [Chloroflexota bacterium]